MITVYLALAHIGAEAGGAGLTGENGAQTLTGVVIQQFGHAGLFILGAIFFIACLNTCVGLLLAAPTTSVTRSRSSATVVGSPSLRSPPP